MTAAARPRFAVRLAAEGLETTVATAVPALLILGLSLKSGGYPAGMPATAACLVLLLLAARIVLAPDTFAGLGGLAAAVAVGLAALTAWAVASMLWSHAPARAVTAGARDLLYLATFLTFATLPRPTLAPVMRGCAAAIVIVALIALAPRLAPDVVQLSSDASSQRLSWPLSYQNALGLLTALGLLLALHLTSERGQAPAVRAAAAASVPVLVCALYLAQSRGAIGAFAVGLLAWIAIARSRWVIAALATVAAPALIMLAVTYEAVELVSPAATPAAVGQGHRVALALVVCVALGAWLQTRARRFDARLEAARLPALRGRFVVIAIVVIAALAAVAGRGQLHERIDQFASRNSSTPLSDPRSRLIQFTNSGRVDLWRGAADTFRERPFLGRGADTFQTAWDRLRPNLSEAREAHSLYFETAAELGVVGLVLVVGIVGGLLACALMAPGERARRGLLVAVVLAWAVHAAVDWDWEMPAVTVVPVALAAAARQRSATAWAPGRSFPVAVAAAVVAILPALWSVSQARSDGALAAFERGDCGAVIRQADGALQLTPFRSEAHLARAACLARAGRDRDALADARAAERADRNDFRLAYDAALVDAAAGGNWHGAAARADALAHHSEYASWLRVWLDEQHRPPRAVAASGPMLLAGEPYPSVLGPYARPGR
jgi:hypothetical protein